MKIGVIDIETTGDNPKKDLIVEIAIIEVDLKKKKMKTIFNSLVKEEAFNKEHNNSWIFQQGFIKFDEVLKAPKLSEFKDELNQLLSKYRVTSFKKDFDITFLKEKGFTVLKQFPCIMITSAKAITEIDVKRPFKWPKLEEAYNFFFKNRKFKTVHRAEDDARIASEITLKIYEMGLFYEFKFTDVLNRLYNDEASIKINEGNARDSEYIHGCLNIDEARKYLNQKFPLHYAKTRQILREKHFLPLACGNIGILDIGCGPFTFTLAILDELMELSSKFARGAFNLNILGIDFSEYSLKIGRKLLNSWEKENSDLNWKFEISTEFDNSNFDDFDERLENWIDSSFHYVFIGYSASLSSGVENLELLLSKLSNYKNRINFYIIIIEPRNFPHGIDLNELRSKFPIYFFEDYQTDVHCKKPDKMNSSHQIIFSEFESNIISNNNHEILNLLNSTRINTSLEKFVLFYGKTKRWLMGELLYDSIASNLFEHDIGLSRKLIIFNILNFKKKQYYTYKIQKGFKPYLARKIYIAPLYINFLNILLLDTIGKSLDKTLGKNIHGRRMCKTERLDKIYEYYTIGYTSFSDFDLKFPLSKVKPLCHADIKSYYDNIDHNILSECLVNQLKLLKMKDSIANLLLDLTGLNVGLPVGLPISPLLANLYLKQFDKKIDDNKRILEYSRYMDDLKLIVDLKSLKGKKRLLSYLDRKLEDLKLNINQSKFEIIDRKENLIFREYNFLFKDYTERYFELLTPIKLSLAFLMKFYKENHSSIEKDIKTIVKKIKYLFNGIRIAIHEEALERYLILTFYNLNKPIFVEEIKKERAKRKLVLKIPEDIIEKEWDDLLPDFLKTNQKWIEKCREYSKDMFDRITEELDIWEDLITASSKLDVKSSSSEYTDFIDELEKVVSSKKFIYSFRLIKYLTFRLTRFTHDELFLKNNPILSKIFNLDRLYFPVKLLGHLGMQYNFDGLVFDLLDKSLQSGYRMGNKLFRRIYPNAVGYLIREFILYYREKPEEFRNDKLKWIDKLKSILDHRPFEEQLAATEFIIRLNLVNSYSLNEWHSWVINCRNLMVLKNLIICTAFHKGSTEVLPAKYKDKILKYYKYDEAVISLTMNLWSKIKENPKVRLESRNLLLELENLNEIVDLNFELRSLFEWDEGFGSNPLY